MTFHFESHIVIAQTFIGPRPNPADDIRHKDGNPMNNRADNLEYGSRSDNIADSKRHGTFPLLENRPKAILNRSQAIEIAKNTIDSARILAIQYGVSSGTINAIRHGRSWKTVTEGFRQPTYRKRGVWMKFRGRHPSTSRPKPMRGSASNDAFVVKGNPEQP